MGWALLENGELLAACEKVGFDALITCDRNLGYQQNLTDRRLAIVEITANNWGLIEPHSGRVASALENLVAGSYLVVEIALPHRSRRR
jgi:hypothetical protein